VFVARSLAALRGIVLLHRRDDTVDQISHNLDEFVSLVKIDAADFITIVMGVGGCGDASVSLGQLRIAVGLVASFLERVHWPPQSSSRQVADTAV
jgi:hypothetical protein